MVDRRRALGAKGESLVAAWYEARGYTVMARNWRKRDGELDLVVRNGRTFVFCEVKTRTSDAFGSPSEAVTHDKRARLRHLAARWLTEESPGPPREIRFDVASVMAGAGGPTLEVIEGAF